MQKEEKIQIFYILKILGGNVSAFFSGSVRKIGSFSEKDKKTFLHSFSGWNAEVSFCSTNRCSLL